MTFTSYTFLFVFLPATVLGYALLKRVRPPLALPFLLLSSLAFYGWGELAAGIAGKVPSAASPLGVLVVSLSGNGLVAARLRRKPSRGLLAAAIVANLLLLAVFKYGPSLNELGRSLLHLAHDVAPKGLPAGLSFYTFVQIAFLVETFRGEALALSPVRHAAFVSFFPHVLAGPISFAEEVAPKLDEERPLALDRFNLGLSFLTIGLFKKLFFADTCAPWADAFFSKVAGTSMVEAWTGVLAYTFQLYFDFSGYSDMAIGIALFFGVRLPANFRSPYQAIDLNDFWQRWHITLTRFLREYVFFALPGNRKEPRRLVNLFLTMLVSGVWHGATLTFIAWGAYQGALMVGNQLWRKLKRPLPDVAARLLTFFCVVLGWVLFRAGSFGTALDVYGRLFDAQHVGWRLLGEAGNLVPALFLVFAFLFVQLAPASQDWLAGRRLGRREGILLGVLFFVALALMRTVVLEQTKSQFLYFQF